MRPERIDSSIQSTLRLTALMLRQGHYSVGERLSPMYLEQAADLIDDLTLTIVLLKERLNED